MASAVPNEIVHDGAVGRDANLNLTARHNRCFSERDMAGWIATFRHSGARFVRDGAEFTDLREAFDGGGGRLVTVDQEITVDGVNATQRCVALLFTAGDGGSTLRATGSYRDQLIYERGGWYFASRELQWDSVPVSA